MQKSLLLTACLVLSCASATASPAPEGIPADMPQDFHASDSSFDYIRRNVMIPMRDGKKLHTVIMIPKGAHGAPILLTRTPYNADEMVTHNISGHMRSALQGYDNMPDVIADGGYIRVIQDVRGKYGSEGSYVMNRPLRGPLNKSTVDHATDTWDTIEWLVHNVHESNGKVGIIGVSYDGFTSMMALFNPHPALRAVVPMNPMIDGWRGDDWFHNGAFRQQMLPYIYDQDATRSNTAKWWSSYHDDYNLYLDAVSAGALGKSHGMDQIGFFRQILAHPAYDSFWQDMAVDRQIAGYGLKVPTLLVHSLWDQEDIVGAIGTYYALHDRPDSRDNLFLVMGPWNHGGEIRQASTMGAVRLGSDTGAYFRTRILEPFLAHYLKDDSSVPLPAHVTAFRSGRNEWESSDSLPSQACSPCTTLYLGAGHTLGLSKADSAAGTEEYVSDPARPVPYLPRAIEPIAHTPVSAWPNWLASDQREASGRTDVATFTSPVLTAPLDIQGLPVAHLTASTTGTDGDFVVKLIDVYPDEVPEQPEIGGYQLMVSADILRGRYRRSIEHPEPIPANTPQLYSFALPVANHTFLPGHRVMIQVQSSWFPLYDRNPQTYVDNIFLAPPAAYRPAKISIDLANSWIDVHSTSPVANPFAAPRP
ncbi:glutaryl-7-ACA acylase [Novacetimonas cocois]|uniref:Glutaryl-7-ACA acylase n=2 Tax=Novacetimonas cocois TaxID=1747507 RepID=A0A365YTR4_9PROT|nr:glutaryl-7-ACA acylase [Novacetimonas cocois]